MFKIQQTKANMHSGSVGITVFSSHFYFVF